MTEVASATRRVLIPPDLNLLALLGRNDEHLKLLETQYDVRVTSRGHDVQMEQRVLLALTQAGLSREESYALVQRNAMKVWGSEGSLSLLDLLKADPDVTARLSSEELEALFDLDYHFRRIDVIFDRVFAD